MRDKGKKLSKLSTPASDLEREALIGKDFELDAETAEEILRSYQLSSDQITGEFKSRLQERIRRNELEGGKEAENENLRFFLNDIKNYQKARSPDNIRPLEWIKSLIDNTTQQLFPTQGLARAYRGRKDDELSEKDQKLIDDLEAELNDDD
jgi:hypothetical protein